MSFKLSLSEDMIREVLASDGEFRIYPSGTSMQPLIREGRDSVVLVQPQFPLSADEIILYRRSNGQYVLHRIKEVQEDSYVLWGDHQLFWESSIKKHQIIASVAAVFREDKALTRKHLIYRIYMILWRYTLIRRIYLIGKRLQSTHRKRRTGL